MVILKLKENEIDELLNFLKDKPTAPEGLNRSYLWENTKFNFINIWYSKDESINNVFYGFGLKDSFVLETWYEGKNFEKDMLELISKFKVKVFIGLQNKKIGEKLGWELTEKVKEMKLSNAKFKDTELDFSDNYREGVINLLSQEWWTRDQAENFVEVTSSNPEGFNKIILLDNKVVAFGHAMYDQGRAWINAVYVDRDYRRKGFGEKISKSIIRKLFQLGVKDVYLGVDANNIKAVNLYKKLGFKFTSFEKYQFEVR